MLAGGHPVGRRLGHRHQQLVLQTRDANLEELVQVLPQDGEEADPLQQRERRIEGHGENTFIEVELGKLPVEVAAS